MELSRLSNSLGSVCSQRRGRLAAVAGRPRLSHSLSHQLPLHFPLSRVTGAFSCACSCLTVRMSSLLQLTCKTVLLSCPKRRSGPSDTGPIADGVGQSQPWSSTQCSSLSRTLACDCFSPSSSKPPPTLKE